MRNVLVVGCGLTGSTVVHLLRAAASQLNVHVWDKGARPGGRFTTFIDRATGGTCDMGCQVVVPDASGSLGYPADPDMYSKLTKAGLLQPLDSAEPVFSGDVLELLGRENRGAGGGGAGGGREQGPPLLVGSARAGMTGVTTCLTQGVSVQQARRLTRLDLSTTHTTAGGGQWVARAEEGAASSSLFDAVVLTMPAPQMLTDLQGDVRGVLHESGAAEALRHAHYCSKFALGLLYPASSCAALSSLPWTLLRPPVHEPDVGLVSLEHKKRRGADGQRQQQEAVLSVLVQSTTAFADRHMDVSDKDTVTRLLQEGLSRVLGGPALPPPLAVKFNKWKYSQVTRRVPGEHGGAMGLTARGKQGGPLLVLAGDSFTASTFDGCVASGRRAADLVLAHFGSSSGSSADQPSPA